MLDAFCGDEQLRRRAEARLAWRELAVARKRHEELTQGAAATDARLAELRALVEDTLELEPGYEDSLRDERERLRHLTELVEGASSAAEALDPDDGEGAAGLTAAAERSLAPVERLAPELQKAADELRDAELRLREAASALRSFLGALEADPRRVEQVESELDRIAEARRRTAAPPTTSCSPVRRRRAPNSRPWTRVPTRPRPPERRWRRRKDASRSLQARSTTPAQRRPTVSRGPSRPS